MPVWLVTVLTKIIAPLAVAALQKAGLVTWAEALAVKIDLKVENALKDVKTYSNPDTDFPKGKNGQ